MWNQLKDKLLGIYVRDFHDLTAKIASTYGVQCQMYLSIARGEARN